jgi:dihydroflavonol-4-reductase
MKALVTGGTGFVGSAVARALLREAWKVRVLSRAGSDDRNLRDTPVDWVVGDLLDLSSVERALIGCDALFHVAGDYRFGVRSPEMLYRTNVDGTRNALTAARHARVRMVHTSSVAAIGAAAGGAPGSEDTPVALDDMIGHYKRSKYLAEALVSAAASEGADLVIVNPSTPIGPGDRKPTPTGRMVLDAASGRIPAYVNTGLNVVHVDDVAQGHILAFERGRARQRYILGGENMTLRDILSEIARICSRRPPRVRLPHAAVLPVAYISELVARVAGLGTQVTVEAVRMARKPMYFSSAKARQELGYGWRSPTAAFEDAVTWFRAEGLLH